jgi:hypothetical protein
LVALALTAAGCAGRGEATATKGAPSQQDREEALLKFAECMRDHGIDLPDPQTGSGGSGLRIARPEGPDMDSDKARAARDACGKYLDDVRQEFTPEQRAEFQDRMLAFAKCMRANGVDMPDPDFSDAPGGGRDRIRLFAGANRDDPNFQKADKACREKAFGGDGGPGRGPFMIGPGPGARR